MPELKYGYILAAIEYDYWQRKQKALSQLQAGEIGQEHYVQLIESAEKLFHGEQR